MTEERPRPRVLFVCVENSCRSQMAEGFARMIGGEGVEAWSAGSRPSGVVNPKAVAAMKAVGYDLTTHTSKGLETLPSGPFAATITMGCGDACPHVPAHLREDWAIPDPKNMEPEFFARVRDDIRSRVADLLSRISEDSVVGNDSEP